MWSLAVLVVTFLAGCSGSSSVDFQSAKAITAYSVAGVAGTVNETAKTVAVTMPYGTDVTALVATFTTAGTGVKVGNAVQTSGSTANNFAVPVAYTVTALDNSTATYTVTVIIAPDSAKAITAYSFVGFAGVGGIVNEPSKSIAVTLPFGTDVTALAATFTTTGIRVNVGSTVQASAITANNFTAPVLYTLTAADGSAATYTVTVIVAQNPAKAVTAYSFIGFTGFAGTVNEPAKTIAVNLPFGTNRANLIAAFTTTGGVVTVSDVAQTSGTTANNFTAPVAYTVTAADGSAALYTVNVTVAADPAKAISAYSFAGFTGAAGVVNETAKTIAVTVPFGTDVSGLVATFTTTGTVVKVGTTVQTSTAIANNFTSPVAYIVTAADGSTATYTVKVTVAQNPAKAISAYSFVGFTGFAGTVNEAAKSIAVTVPFGTNVTGLVATFSTTGAAVKVGTTVQTSSATANNFTAPVAYIVAAADGSTATYTVSVTVAPNPAKAITAYSFNGFTEFAGTINEAAKTITVTLPFGTPVTALTSKFTTTGPTVKVDTAVQTSGTTPNTFALPVAYTVTAADNSTAVYTVTVTVAPNSAKAVTAYSFNGVAGIINEAAKSIAVTMSKGTDVTKLVATLIITGNTVTVGSAPVVLQTSGITVNDFTSPVVYTVTAADNSTVAYTVTVKVATSLLPVNLGTAGNFVILANSGVSTTGTTAVVGDIGLSPAAASFITGFGLIADSTNTFSTSSLVVGKVYASDYTPPTPAYMTTAVGDMVIAFNDAAGRVTPDFTELGAGDISGLTLVPGLYKWGTGVLVTSAGVTLSGGANDVWIFQIAQDLTINNSAIITLAGGAQAKNIFWQVSGQATLGTAADFKGIILSQTLISLNTGAVMNGRALAQTAVTLNATAITAP
jgi:hypothetical protein